MRWPFLFQGVLGFGAAVVLGPLAQADPLISSWVTSYSGQYARVYQTDSDKVAGTTRTTWPSPAYSSQVTVGQALPTYVGIHQIDYSANWVYLKTTGLGIHVMGPWYLNSARTQIFPNMPKNVALTYRFPRTPSITGVHTNTSLGVVGVFVDGVAMFDNRDSYSVATYTNGTTITESPQGQGIWNRDAYINESVTFDPGNAHQPNSGQYHYHINPVALRYVLGDNILFNASSKTYSENTANAAPVHSPILGWAADGLPIYGPYGYSISTDATSPVRRMISGYVPRNGQNGTTNLASTGRTTLPAWAKRAQNRTTLSTSQYGPNVTTTYPLGRYLEDNEYLGDLGKVQGTDFDLNEFNCRYCVTPEFPGGTYAYFLDITANGAPNFPYILGRQFYGVPSGGTVSSISEPVTNAFKGGPNLTETMQAPAVADGDVMLTWSSVEGGSYKLESTNDLVNWSGTNVAAAVGTRTSYTDAAAESTSSQKFYRVGRTSLATYDSAGF